VVNLERALRGPGGAAVRRRVFCRDGPPVPCTLCNNDIKFDQFLEIAAAHGAERIATGNYARIRRDPENGRYLLLRGVDPAKDQDLLPFRPDAGRNWLAPSSRWAISPR